VSCWELQPSPVYGGVSEDAHGLELDDRRVDQRFLRLFTKRDGVWRAISVAVTPVGV